MVNVGRFTSELPGQGAIRRCIGETHFARGMDVLTLTHQKETVYDVLSLSKQKRSTTAEAFFTNDKFVCALSDVNAKRQSFETFTLSFFKKSSRETNPFTTAPFTRHLQTPTAQLRQAPVHSS
jgi:hypothetical protein